MIALLWELFTTFFVIGLFTFGGGYAMLSLIQTQVVNVHEWISESQFTDIVAVSQMTPGPIGINSATYVGYEVAGFTGSLTATFALVLPSFLVTYTMVRCYNYLKDNRIFTDVMKAVRPVVIGMIGAAAVILMFHISWDGPVPAVSVIGETFPDCTSWAFFAIALLASMWKKVNPILLIVAGGLLGMIIY